MAKYVRKTDRPATLTGRAEKFIFEYIRLRNKTQAYIEAGYSAKGADVSAQRLYNQPHIKAEIEKRINEINQKAMEEAQLTVNKIVDELAKIAFFDHRKLYNPLTNMPRKIADLDADCGAAIMSSSCEDGVVTDFKLYNKVNCLIKLGEYKGMFKEEPNDQVKKEEDAFNRLSPAEQKKRINERRKQAGLEIIDGGTEDAM